MGKQGSPLLQAHSQCQPADNNCLDNVNAYKMGMTKKDANHAATHMKKKSSLYRLRGIHLDNVRGFIVIFNCRL